MKITSTQKLNKGNFLKALEADAKSDSPQKFSDFMKEFASDKDNAELVDVRVGA